MLLQKSYRQCCFANINTVTLELISGCLTFSVPQPSGRLRQVWLYELSWALEIVNEPVSSRPPPCSVYALAARAGELYFPVGCELPSGTWNLYKALGMTPSHPNTVKPWFTFLNFEFSMILHTFCTVPYKCLEVNVSWILHFLDFMPY